MCAHYRYTPSVNLILEQKFQNLANRQQSEVDILLLNYITRSKFLSYKYLFSPSSFSQVIDALITTDGDYFNQLDFAD